MSLDPSTPNRYEAKLDILPENGRAVITNYATGELATLVRTSDYGFEDDPAGTYVCISSTWSTFAPRGKYIVRPVGKDDGLKDNCWDIEVIEVEAPAPDPEPESEDPAPEA